MLGKKRKYQSVTDYEESDACLNIRNSRSCRCLDLFEREKILKKNYPGDTCILKCYYMQCFKQATKNV